MPIVMVLQGLPDGSATGFDGQYLKDFDHEALDGQGEAALTTDIKSAKRFRNMMEAFEFYRRVPKVKPVREDGLPNRPLTATNWEFRVVGWLNN